LDSLYLLIPVALVFVAIGIKLLLWAIDDGQYDDLDKEAWRILADENKELDTSSSDKSSNKEQSKP
jgi:cbb3-type cytochrome oxidase maturation protein